MYAPGCQVECSGANCGPGKAHQYYQTQSNWESSCGSTVCGAGPGPQPSPSPSPHPGQCSSWEDGRNSQGTNLKQAPWSEAPKDCCDHCGETQGCVAWTFIKGSHECWLKSWVPDQGQWQGDGNAVSGMGGGGHSPDTKCSWEDGQNSQGTNLKQAPWSEAPQDCCNHCGETQGCVAWTFIKGSHECWLKSWVPDRAQWQGDGNAVSGKIGAPRALSQPASNLSTPDLGSSPDCVQLSGTYCGGQGQECNCNYCDDFCKDDPCARTCRVLNGHFSAQMRSGCSWTARSIHDPRPGEGGVDCSWMEGNGQGGKGDDCQLCDDYAMKCRRANPSGNCNV